MPSRGCHRGWQDWLAGLSRVNQARGEAEAKCKICHFLRKTGKCGELVNLVLAEQSLSSSCARGDSIIVINISKQKNLYQIKKIFGKTGIEPFISKYIQHLLICSDGASKVVYIIDSWTSWSLPV